MPRGSAPGERRGGRKKGSVNKITSVQRAAIQKFLDKHWHDADAIFEDIWHGIEIEKQLPDGTTVTGRLNADPKGALEIMNKLADFCIPRLRAIEVAGAGGGPLEVVVLHETRKEGE